MSSEGGSYGPISCPAMTDKNPLEGVVPKEYHDVLTRALFSTLGHPMENAKTLIQIGHEPLSPINTKTLFGRPVLQLPSVFRYMGYIKRRDGFLALYRGWAPKMASIGLSAVVKNQMAEFWPQKKPKNPYRPSQEEVIEDTARQAAEKMAVLIVTHPLHVCTVRAIAQFIGKEEKYDGVFGAIIAIYKEDGVLGYYAGFVPRAIGELLTIGLTGAAVYAVNNYVFQDNDMKSFTQMVANFLASSLCYPFQVVGNCMAVSRSGLAASYPPHMPLYRNWIDCWSHLSSKKQLKRGSSMFFRYYTGPQVVVGDRAFPIN